MEDMFIQALKLETWRKAIVMTSTKLSRFLDNYWADAK